MRTNPNPIIEQVRNANETNPHQYGGRSKAKARSFVRGSARAWMLDTREKRRQSNAMRRIIQKQAKLT